MHAPVGLDRGAQDGAGGESSLEWVVGCACGRAELRDGFALGDEQLKAERLGVQGLELIDGGARDGVAEPREQVGGCEIGRFEPVGDVGLQRVHAGNVRYIRDLSSVCLDFG